MKSRPSSVANKHSEQSKPSDFSSSSVFSFIVKEAGKGKLVTIKASVDGITYKTRFISPGTPEEDIKNDWEVCDMLINGRGLQIFVSKNGVMHKTIERKDDVSKICKSAEISGNDVIITVIKTSDISNIDNLIQRINREGNGLKGTIIGNGIYSSGKIETSEKTVERLKYELSVGNELKLNINKTDGKVSGNTLLGMTMIAENIQSLESLVTRLFSGGGELKIVITKIGKNEVKPIETRVGESVNVGPVYSDGFTRNFPIENHSKTIKVNVDYCYENDLNDEGEQAESYISRISKIANSMSANDYY